LDIGVSDINDIQFLARLFLALFVLIGVAPYLLKRIIGFLDYLVSLQHTPALGSSEYVYNLEASMPESARLEGVDYIVLVQLAQAGDGGETLRNLQRKLHMEQMLLINVLLSLNKKQLVRVRQQTRFRRRFYLSEKGKAYAATKGLIFGST
jgi:DNA-binding MarR family transcriptional regulator